MSLLRSNSRWNGRAANHRTNAKTVAAARVHHDVQYLLSKHLKRPLFSDLNVVYGSTAVTRHPMATSAKQEVDELVLWR